VPLSSAERRGTLWRVLEGVFSKRDHEFESAFLQRGVRNELLIDAAPFAGSASLT
jgi:hypothetical protein